MTKFILHGGFTRKDNGLNHAFHEEFARGIPAGGTVLHVYFASRSDDTSEVFEEHKRNIIEHAHGKNLNFLFATKENFLDQITQSDAVQLHGGSTNKLLTVLRTYPDLKPLVENKTVAGSSAGAYALARFGASHSEEIVRKGLGLVPLRVVCHYESPDLPPNAASVSALKNTAQDLELVLLKDFEWKVFNY